MTGAGRFNLQTASAFESYITNYALQRAVTNLAPPRESSTFAAILDNCELWNRAGTCRDVLTNALADNCCETVEAYYLIDQRRIADPDLLERDCGAGYECVAVRDHGLSKPLMQYQTTTVQAQLARYLTICNASKRKPDEAEVSKIYGRIMKCGTCMQNDLQLLYWKRRHDYEWKKGTTVNDEVVIPQHYQVFQVECDLRGEYKSMFCIPEAPTASFSGKQVVVTMGPVPFYYKGNYRKGLRKSKITGKYYEGLLENDELIQDPDFAPDSVRDAQGHSATLLENSSLMGFH